MLIIHKLTEDVELLTEELIGKVDLKMYTFVSKELDITVSFKKCDIAAYASTLQLRSRYESVLPHTQCTQYYVLICV